jgi:hypothetical protein
MKTMHRIGLWLSLLFFSACASGPKIDTGIGTTPTSAFGWNIGAGDLLNPDTAPQRLGTYLDELAGYGYAKQIRIIYTPDWGPFILQHWIPVIRSKGFRVLVILSQDGRAKPGDSDLTRQASWIREGLPAISGILDAVQLANEPDGFSGKTPAEYTAWHRQMVQMVRQVVPGVPIIGPDLRLIGKSLEWVKATGLVSGPDYDVLSLHVTGNRAESDLQQIIDGITAIGATKVWVTEGDWGETAYLRGKGMPIERTYVYIWNGHEPESRRPGGPLP